MDSAVDLLQVQFHFKALEQGLVDAWQEHFADCPAVRADLGSILDEQADAIVSPANSFGYMDGGLDLVYSRHFGWEVEKRVRETILSEHDGELPIGEAIVCSMDRDAPPFFMISAPTMRVPMRVDQTANAYLAFRGVLRAVRRFNRHAETPIRTILCPGLGTGEGRMPFDRCALQMRYAYDVVAHGRLLKIGGLAGAVENHMALLQVEPD